MTWIQLHKYYAFTYLDRRKTGNCDMHRASLERPDCLCRGYTHVDEICRIRSPVITQPCVCCIINPDIANPTEILENRVQRISEKQTCLRTPSLFQNVGHDDDGCEPLMVRNQVLK